MPVQGGGGCADRQPSLREKHQAKVSGTVIAKEPAAFSASVGVLNITVSGRNFNLDKLNYCWIYSQMQNYFCFLCQIVPWDF